jgi:hypothetical protein
MVVNRGAYARLQCLRLIMTGVALAASSGCASSWLKAANESELPLAESQAPKVYSKAISATQRANDTQQPRAAASEVDVRMARELERLTKLNNELAKTIAKSPATPAAQPPAAQTPQKDEQERAKQQIRQASQAAISQDLRSEFIELATAKGRPDAALDKALTKFSFSDDAEAGEQSPAPVVEKTQTRDETKLAEPSPSDKPTPPLEERSAIYQAGDWLKARDHAIAQLQEEISLARSDKSRSAEVGHLESLLRMHYALAGRRDDAVKPVKELREQEQEFWRNQALGLADLLGTDRLANESRRFAVALKSLEEAESQLAAAGSLALRNIAICRKVQDFGVVERFKTNDFLRNQEVLLYVEVRNFTAKQKEDHQYETELQGSFRVLDRSGTSRAERTLPLDKQTCANLRRDYYIAYRLYIPSELSPGSYTLELTIEDKKGNKSNNALLDFNVTQ